MNKMDFLKPGLHRIRNIASIMIPNILTSAVLGYLILSKIACSQDIFLGLSNSKQNTIVQINITFRKTFLSEVSYVEYDDSSANSKHYFVIFSLTDYRAAGDKICYLPRHGMPIKLLLLCHFFHSFNLMDQ